MNLQGTIHPFRKTHRSVFGKLLQEVHLVASDRRVSQSFNATIRVVFVLKSNVIFVYLRCVVSQLNLMQTSPWFYCMVSVW